MEEKQLDFNQPILSVRRFSLKAVSQYNSERKTDTSPARIPPLPSYKSELKSGPVTNPGTVPFVWEQTPGRPKDESKPPIRATELPPIVPKLPPGRVFKANNQDSVEVPEQASFTQSQTGHAQSTTAMANSNSLSLDKNVAKYESSKEATMEKESSGSNDGDETYLDALDTLSRTESFFLNCSVSGLSALDDKDVKPYECFSTDAQAREFMMDRFLPAAKAMASEAPQYSTRKPTVAQEQSMQVKKAINKERKHPTNLHMTNVSLQISQDIVGKVSEDELDDYSGSENYGAKVCGLLPRFCLLNPILGMGVQGRAPISPAHRLHARASSVTYNEIRKEHSRKNINEKELASGVQGAELHENRIEIQSNTEQHALRSSSQKLNGSSLYKRLQCPGTHNLYFQSLLHEENDSLVVPEKTKNFSLNRIDTHGSKHHNHGELLSSENIKGDLDEANPAAEKTLYIDSIHTVTSHSSSGSSHVKDQLYNREEICENFAKDSDIEKISSLDSALKDCEDFGGIDMNEILRCKSSVSLDSCFSSCSDRSNYDVHMEESGSKDKGLVQDSRPLTNSKGVGSVRVNLRNQDSMKSEYEVSFQDGIKDSVIFSDQKMVGSRKTHRESQKKTHKVCSDGHFPDLMPLRCSKVACDVKNDQPHTKSGYQESSDDRKIDLENQWMVKLGNGDQLPLGPPLPKSPSESWLKRTLPRISSRNASSLAAQIHIRTQTSKEATPDAEWETIVKYSKLHFRN